MATTRTVGSPEGIIVMKLQAKNWNDFYVKFTLMNSCSIAISIICILPIQNMLAFTSLLVFTAVVHTYTGVAATILFTRKLRERDSDAKVMTAGRLLFPILNAVLVCTLTFLVWIAFR